MALLTGACELHNHCQIDSKRAGDRYAHQSIHSATYVQTLCPWQTDQEGGAKGETRGGVLRAVLHHSTRSQKLKGHWLQLVRCTYQLVVFLYFIYVRIWETESELRNSMGVI